MYKKTILLFILSLCIVPVLLAQSEGPNSITSGQIWLGLNTSTAINPKLAFQAESEVDFSSDTNTRSSRAFDNFTQYSFRGWLHYYLKPRLKLSYSFGFWHNTDVAEAGQYDYNEIRNCFQLLHYIVKRKATIINRINWDHRYLQNEAHTQYVYNPRFRYSPRLSYVLNGNVIREKALYGILMDELYLTPNRDLFIQQNRLIAGIGYCFTNDIILEAAYTYQYRFSTNARDAVTNAISFTLSINNIFKRTLPEK